MLENEREKENLVIKLLTKTEVFSVISVYGKYLSRSSQSVSRFGQRSIDLNRNGNCNFSFVCLKVDRDLSTRISDRIIVSVQYVLFTHVVLHARLTMSQAEELSL